MKGKLSATVDEPLLEFLDSLPGKTRSRKARAHLEKVPRASKTRGSSVIS